MCSENMHKKRIKTFMVNTNLALSHQISSRQAVGPYCCVTNQVTNLLNISRVTVRSSCFLYAPLSLRPLPTPLSLSPPLLLPPPPPPPPSPPVCGSCLLKGNMNAGDFRFSKSQMNNDHLGYGAPPPPPPPTLISLIMQNFLDVNIWTYRQKYV